MEYHRWKRLQYRAVNDGGDEDGPEPAEKGVGGEGSKYREEIRYADPSVHNLHRRRGRLVEVIREVRDEVARQPTESKSLRHFNDCKHIIKPSKQISLYKIKESLAAGNYLQMMKMAAFHPPVEGFRWVKHSLPFSRLPSSIIFWWVVLRASYLRMVGAK